MSSSKYHNGSGDDRDFVIPYDVIDERVNDPLDTEQHKARRGTKVRKRSIKHYRHATTKWGAALEGFSPMWVCRSDESML